MGTRDNLLNKNWASSSCEQRSCSIGVGSSCKGCWKAGVKGDKARRPDKGRITVIPLEDKMGKVVEEASMWDAKQAKQAKL